MNANKVKENSIIPIVMICDNNYVIPTCVTITTIIKNKNSNTKYHFYILTDGLNEESTKYFLAFKSQDINLSIITADIESIKAACNSGAHGKYCVATETALLKFEIPNLIKEHKKIIYLDGDIICRKDLSGLYNTKLKNLQNILIQV